MKEICAKMNIQTIDTGIKHGTITMMIPVGEERIPVEVTTFRKDVDTDGRNATIEYAITIEEDLSRRDFKFNAMAVSLEDGTLLDPFNGLKDIKKKEITFVGEAKDRIMEDHLRMIRYIRFSFQLEFPIDVDYFNDLKVNFNINVLSKERIKMEMDKIIDKLKYKNLSNFHKLFDTEILLKDGDFKIFNLSFLNKNHDKLSLINKFYNDNGKENTDVKRMFKYSLMLLELNDEIIVRKLKFSNIEFDTLKQIKLMENIFTSESDKNIAIKKMINQNVSINLIKAFIQLEDKKELIKYSNNMNNYTNFLHNIVKSKVPCKIKDLKITSEIVEKTLKEHIKESDFKKEFIGKCLKFLIDNLIVLENKNNEDDLKKLIAVFSKECYIKNDAEICNDGYSIV